MSGFITIERDLWKHPVFARSEMTEREAWMWMIANAAWAGTQHRVGADVVEVPRGSFMVTLREMQSAFMWKSDKRVRNFLQKLENHGMLTVQTLGQRNARKTHVTICNYDEYQSGGRSKDAAKTHEGRTTDAVKEQGNKVTRKDTNVSLDALAAEIISSVASPSVAADFVAHRREIKKPLTERAAIAVVNKIQGHPNPDAVLNDSIANGWQGVFPEKTGGRNDRTNRNSNAAPDRRQDRSDPAVDQILRLTGLSQASGDGGSGTGSDGEEDGSFRMGAGSWDVGARQADEGLDFGAPRLSVVGGTGRMSGMG